MKHFVIILFLFVSQMAFANLGHRMGGGKKEYHKNLPENSLGALKASLEGINNEKGIQWRDDFEYVEFDVHESYDGEIVVIHDDTLKRTVLEKNPANKEAILKLTQSADLKKRLGVKTIQFSKLKVKDLTLVELKTLRLENSTAEQIPTLQEVLLTAIQYRLFKPLVVELKEIRTDRARERMLSQVTQFREQYLKFANVVIVPKYDFPFEVGFMGFSGAFKKSLKGDTKAKSYKEWCQVFVDLGYFGVFRPITHGTNHCKKYL